MEAMHQAASWKRLGKRLAYWTLALVLGGFLVGLGFRAYPALKLRYQQDQHQQAVAQFNALLTGRAGAETLDRMVSDKVLTVDSISKADKVYVFRYTVKDPQGDLHYTSILIDGQWVETMHRDAPKLPEGEHVAP